MPEDTILVTGGNGTIGNPILRELSRHDYETVNLSHGLRSEEVSDWYIRSNLLDFGDVVASGTV